jgi:hypothetical protein
MQRAYRALFSVGSQVVCTDAFMTVLLHRSRGQWGYGCDDGRGFLITTRVRASPKLRPLASGLQRLGLEALRERFQPDHAVSEIPTHAVSSDEQVKRPRR